MLTQAFQASQVFLCSAGTNTTRLLFHHLRRANIMTTQDPDPLGELFCSKKEEREKEFRINKFISAAKAHEELSQISPRLNYISSKTTLDQ